MGTTEEERQLHHCRVSSISINASHKSCSSSGESSTSSSLRVFESVTRSSDRRRDFLSGLLRWSPFLDCELILLEFAVKSGAPDAEQIRGDGAIAFGISERFQDGLSLHLG